MSRKLRTDTIAPGSAVHVILRGNNRRRIFSFARDYLLFLRLLEFESRRYGVPVHAVALLSNHVHLVVTAPDARTLGRFVKSVSQRYAQRRNAARNGTGKLFEQRYVSVPIADVRQLAATIAYVDLNPVRAGLAAAPEDYLGSTYRLHAGHADAHAAITALWSPHDWYLALSADDDRRARIYRALAEDRRAEAAELEGVAALCADRDDDATPYTLRLRRPDESRVAEPPAPYGVLVRVPEIR